MIIRNPIKYLRCRRKGHRTRLIVTNVTKTPKGFSVFYTDGCVCGKIRKLPIMDTGPIKPVEV